MSLLIMVPENKILREINEKLVLDNRRLEAEKAALLDKIAVLTSPERVQLSLLTLFIIESFF